MKKTLSYTTQGTCSRQIEIVCEDDTIESVQFVGGCSGNTQGVAALVVGMNVDEAIKRIKGIKCGFKLTSCPDQLAIALEKLKEQEA